MIDPEAGDFVTYYVSAPQDRSWDHSHLPDGKESANRRLLADPADTVNLVLSVRNSGNYEDNQPCSAVSADGSIIENWIYVHNSITQIGIGNSSEINATLFIPESSINGTIVVVVLEVIADNGDLMGATSVELNMDILGAGGRP